MPDVPDVCLFQRRVRMMSPRVVLATILARASARLLTGRDDRVVLLNVHRRRCKPGSPDAGRIHAFMTQNGKAVAVTPDEAKRISSYGPPVPKSVAKLAGYEVQSLR